MKVLTIIGNGFDLGHGLPTRFDDFIQSNPTLFQEKYGVFRGSDGSWNAVESKFEELLRDVMNSRSWQALAEEVERILGDYGLNDYGEVNLYGYSFEAYDEEYDRISDFITLLGDFEKDFCTYLKICCSDRTVQLIAAKRLISRILKRSNLIITFNYTHTAELLYGAENIIHIHGDIDEAVAIGSGALEDAKNSTVDYEYPQRDSFSKDKDGLVDMMTYYTEDMDGRIVEDHFIRRFFDGVVAEASEREDELFALLDTKSKDSLDERRYTIDLLKNHSFDMVYIIGHSLGNADRSVFDAINKDAHVVCFYHGQEDKLQKEQILYHLGFDFEMVPDNSLYDH